MEKEDIINKDYIKEYIVSGTLPECSGEKILSMLLSYPGKGKDVNVGQIAKGLFNQFGSISNVCNASIEELCKIDGVTDSIAIIIKLVPAISKVYNIGLTSERAELRTVEQMGDYLIPRYIGEVSEVVYMLCLDCNYRVVSCEEMGTGGLTAVYMDSKKIIQAAMKNNTKYVVLSHNHPMGVAVPSNNDITATLKVYEFLKCISVELIDHIIVADGDFVSMRSSKCWPINNK